MNVSVQLEGTYEQMMKFIRTIEGLNRTVVIRNLSAQSKEDTGVTGTMEVVFYALPKVAEQDEEYFKWPYSNAYGRENPFAKYPGYVNTAVQAAAPAANR